MLNYEITSVAGKHKARKRIGRGTGSGHGKTSGRGHKGSGSRAGATSASLYEGGQMPLFRRLPKRGFSNYKFVIRYQIVNISQLEIFDEGSAVGVEQLSDAGLIDSLKRKVKILGDGQLTKKLDVTAHKFSKSAKQKIVGCGGTAKLIT
ncbi:MAG: 50S ribosomal protein L15 [Planctomycetes bacterium RBG_13_50_24]|jgi:large subunit ribosomal protein L15|nr:MAG: 50S ribosomal protein L15 [Planctomycetes bacterium RBG_13_50_24]